jgi:hypothetical protein
VVVTSSRSLFKFHVEDLSAAKSGCGLDGSDPESDGHESQLPKSKTTYGNCIERPDRAPTKTLRESASTDPDLVELRNAWPTLPPHLKAAILALASTGCG